MRHSRAEESLRPFSAAGQSDRHRRRSRAGSGEARTTGRRRRGAGGGRRGRLLTGLLSVTRAGTGVVDVARGPRITVEPEDLGDAVHGDEVEVRLKRRRANHGGPLGWVARVLARPERRLAGFVEPDPAAGGGNWLFRPVSRRFPVARLAGARAADLAPGRRVVVLLSGGKAPGAPRYRFTEELSSGVDPSQDPVDVAHELGLRLGFAEDAVELSRRRATLPLAVGDGDPPRIDLRDRLCLTIDPADAADFDDAVSWQPLPDGGQEVGVHIADVSRYVERGDAIDREATERGTSVYMPGLVLHMLPEALAAGAASLRPDEARAAISVLVEMDARARVRGWRIVRSLIRSHRRLSYDEAEVLLDSPAGGGGGGPAGGPGPPAADDWRQALRRLGAVGVHLRRRRLARSGLHLELPEAEVDVDADGRATGIRTRRPGVAHHLIEELMLLANRVVGAWARAARLPILYRVHERPRWERLLELALVLDEIGLESSRRNLADPRELTALLAEAAARGVGELVAAHTLRALEKAHYAATDAGHYGLGIDGYCHFTSPIRRYPDLHNHRVVAAAIAALGGGDQAARDAPDRSLRLRAVRAHFAPGLEELAESTSARELGAQNAERLAFRIKVLRLLASRLGDDMTGMIFGVAGAGLHVRLDDHPIEGWVPRERLPRDRYGLGPRGQSLEGRRGMTFALGQRLRVRLERISIVERELELGIVGSVG